MTSTGKNPGGRPKGRRNKKTLQLLKRVEETGITPLDYMLKIMRDKNQNAPRRDDMAKAAAPYVHAKLASLEAKHTGSISFAGKSEAEIRAAVEERLGRLLGSGHSDGA